MNPDQPIPPFDPTPVTVTKPYETNPPELGTVERAAVVQRTGSRR
jgi:hypothetical protein